MSLSLLSFLLVCGVQAAVYRAPVVTPAISAPVTPLVVSGLSASSLSSLTVPIAPLLQAPAPLLTLTAPAPAVAPALTVATQLALPQAEPGRVFDQSGVFKAGGEGPVMPSGSGLTPGGPVLQPSDAPKDQSWGENGLEYLQAQKDRVSAVKRKLGLGAFSLTLPFAVPILAYYLSYAGLALAALGAVYVAVRFVVLTKREFAAKKKADALLARHGQKRLRQSAQLALFVQFSRALHGSSLESSPEARAFLDEVMAGEYPDLSVARASSHLAELLAK